MRLTDAQRKAIGAQGNVLVIAGAGTGKTTTLVERCLNCLLRSTPRASLDEILMVTFTEAAMGAKVDVPTLDGLTTIRIPPGIESGQKLRLRGKGAPSLRASARGDLFVEVQIVPPKVADERSKEILRELARLNPDDPRRDLMKQAGK